MCCPFIRLASCILGTGFQWVPCVCLFPIISVTPKLQKWALVFRNFGGPVFGTTPKNGKIALQLLMKTRGPIFGTTIRGKSGTNFGAKSGTNLGTRIALTLCPINGTNWAQVFQVASRVFYKKEQPPQLAHRSRNPRPRAMQIMWTVAAAIVVKICTQMPPGYSWPLIDCQKTSRGLLRLVLYGARAPIWIKNIFFSKLTSLLCTTLRAV